MARPRLSETVEETIYKRIFPLLVRRPTSMDDPECWQLPPTHPNSISFKGKCHSIKRFLYEFTNPHLFEMLAKQGLTSANFRIVRAGVCRDPTCVNPTHYVARKVVQHNTPTQKKPAPPPNDIALTVRELGLGYPKCIVTSPRYVKAFRQALAGILVSTPSKATCGNPFCVNPRHIRTKKEGIPNSLTSSNYVPTLDDIRGCVEYATMDGLSGLELLLHLNYQDWPTSLIREVLSLPEFIQYSPFE